MARETSIAALADFNEAPIRERVQVLFQEYGAMTDEDLYDIFQAVYDEEVKESTVRARRIELGAVDTGERKANRSGRLAIVWDLA